MSEYLNRLIADDWGSENKGGTSEIKEVAPEKKRPPVPNIEGVTLGIPVRSDRRRCRVCGFNLDSQNRCSQKKCKLFLKVQ